VTNISYIRPRKALNEMAAGDTQVERIHKELLVSYIPIIVVMVILALVGITGNIASIFFFGMKSKNRRKTTNVFVTYLGVFDLIVSLLISTTIADLIYNVYYSSLVLCRIMFFVDQWFMTSSVFTLWLISIDRYLKVCRPVSSWQFSGRSANISTAMAVAFALVFSVKVFFTTGIVIRKYPTENGTVEVHDCANADGQDMANMVKAANIIDGLSVAMVLCTFFFTYGNILKTIQDHNKKQKMKKLSLHLEENNANGGNVNEGREHTDESNVNGLSSSSGVYVNTVTDNADKSSEDVLEESTSNATTRTTTNTNNVPGVAQISTISGSKTTGAGDSLEILSKSIDKSIKRQSQGKPEKCRALHRYERTLSVMMFVVSVGLLLCFLPFVVWNTIVATDPKAGQRELELGIQFILRSPFLNSVINPVIFIVFNPQYRRFIVGVITRFRYCITSRVYRLTRYYRMWFS